VKCAAGPSSEGMLLLQSQVLGNQFLIELLSALATPASLERGRVLNRLISFGEGLGKPAVLIMTWLLPVVKTVC
jgi:hypothetical protein